MTSSEFVGLIGIIAALPILVPDVTSVLQNGSHLCCNKQDEALSFRAPPSCAPARLRQAPVLAVSFPAPAFLAQACNQNPFYTPAKLRWEQLRTQGAALASVCGGSARAFM